MRVFPLVLGTLVLLVTPGCDCNGGTGSIACTDDTQCPNELRCDVDMGVCVDPGGMAYDCDPPLPGCTCDQAQNDEPVICQADVEAEDLISSCREGRSVCTVDGVYGPCELVANPFCSSVGGSAGDFDPNPDNSDQVELGPEGELVLDPDVKQVDFGFLWVANTGENTVSKLDIETGREVARYASVRGSNDLGVPGVPSPGGYDGDESNCGNCPSRTAIDFKGDAFVANRAFSQQGTISKFANSFEDCVDYDGNGVIDTSADVDGDGRINVDDPGEFLGEADECILWTVPVGGNNGVPRALAIDAGGPDGEAGNVWVGLYNEDRVVQLSGDTGAPVMRGGTAVQVQVQDGQGKNLSPYGAAVDGNANLWVTGLEDDDTLYLAKINTAAATLTAIYTAPDDDDGCSKGYGISIDTSQRVWLGGWDCRDVKAFDQTSETWIRRDFDDSNTRGTAVDTSGNVWVAFTGGWVARIAIDDIIAMGNAAPAEMFDLPPLPDLPGDDPGTTIGVGIDRNGACWAVSRNDDSELGTATRIDTNGNVESFAVGKRPYTYSDFTGFGLSTVVRPNGFWRGKVGGCATTDAVTDWQTLEWFANEPPGTSVRMRVRVADTVADLASAQWYGPWDTSPVDLDAAGVPDAKYMEVEVQLSTDDPDVTPSFIGFSVGFTCPGAPPVE